MPDSILQLPLAERAEVLQALAPKAGLPPHVLEKDIWVCWALLAVFEMPDRLPIAFKGGTALSKVFSAINRFSEDVDLTIDYTALNDGVNPLVQEVSRNAIKKLTAMLRERVAAHVTKVVAPYLARRGKDELGVEFTIEIIDGEALVVRYPSQFTNTDSYMPSRILLEFGGRNTTLPNELHDVTPYAAAYTNELAFPLAKATVLSPRRMFWEKATLIHSECHRPLRQGAGPERLSRHWYDLMMIVDHEIGKGALADRDLLGEVVKLKGIFYRSGFANYDACLTGGFRVVPDASFRAILARDYEAMTREGMFFQTPPSFDQIIDRLSQLERVLNSSVS